MLGCFLATTRWRPPHRLAVALVALGVVITFSAPGAAYENWRYVGAALAAVGLVVVAPSWSWLKTRPLLFLGRISYGLYLWHMLLMRLPLHPLITVPLAIIAASLSYRFVEAPILGATRRWAERRATVGRTESSSP